MKKRDKIYDSPEYKQIKEHLPEILKELERDKGLSQYQIPEEWNGDFERIYQKERRKEQIKRRILAGACAAVILTISAVHIGTHLEFTSVAQADDIGKTRENGFEDGNYQYSTYGNDNEDDLTIADDAEIFFEGDNVEVIQKKIKEEIKRPMFWLNDIDKKAIVKDARYNKLYNNISFRTYMEDNYIYVSQQKQIKSTGNGNVSEESIIDTVKNENMDIQVKISRSTHDESLKCNIMYDNTVLSVVSNLELQEFEKLIENITYK